MTIISLVQKLARDTDRSIETDGLTTGSSVNFTLSPTSLLKTVVKNRIFKKYLGAFKMIQIVDQVRVFVFRNHLIM